MMDGPITEYEATASRLREVVPEDRYISLRDFAVNFAHAFVDQMEQTRAQTGIHAAKDPEVSAHLLSYAIQIISSCCYHINEGDISLLRQDGCIEYNTAFYLPEADDFYFTPSRIIDAFCESDAFPLEGIAINKIELETFFLRLAITCLNDITPLSQTQLEACSAIFADVTARERGLVKTNPKDIFMNIAQMAVNNRFMDETNYHPPYPDGGPPF